MSRLTVDAAEKPRALLWLGHGAGGGIDASDLAALASTLPAHGITVVRHEQPWRVAGRRVAPRPAALDEAWLAASPVVTSLAQGVPVIASGRSAGARVACRTARAVEASGVVCLAFPLHPPGAPERSRLDELLTPTVPVLVMQGARDPFGSAELLGSAVAGRDRLRVVTVPDADHSLTTLKASEWTADRVHAFVADQVLEFIDELTAPQH